MDEQTKEIIAKAELSRLMKGIREALGLSQEELGILFGVTRQSVSYYETGHMFPTIRTLDKWLEAVTLQIQSLREDKKNLEKELKKLRTRRKNRKHI